MTTTRIDLLDLPWRTGRKLGRTIYVQIGDQPSDDDPLLGIMDELIVATRIVDDHNAWVELKS